MKTGHAINSLFAGRAWWVMDDVAVCVFYEGLGYWTIRTLSNADDLVPLPKNWELL